MKANIFIECVKSTAWILCVMSLWVSPIANARVIDNFNDNAKTAWTDFTFVPGVGLPTESGGQFKFNLPPAGQALFVASTKTSETFTLQDGRTIEFRVDLVSGNGKDAFGVLAFIPTTSSASTLGGYGLAKSTTDVLITKGINKYFYNENPTPEIKNENVMLVLSLTGSGNSVIINSKVLDKDNNNAVLFEKTFVDTPAADVLSDGNDDPAAPYLGSGNFVLYCYEDFDKNAPQESYEVVFDNLEVYAPPVAGNTAPLITDIQPTTYANFLPASTTFSFTVQDDKPLADDQISLALNDTIVTSANGLAISGTGETRTVSFNGLTNQVNYVAKIQVIDSEGATNSAQVFFDTFAANSFVIEMEDYNFDGGSFVNNPVVLPEGSFPQANSYIAQIGLPEVDYRDNRTAPNSYPYRPDDLVAMQRSRDNIRQKYAAAGGAASEIYDYDIGEIQTGEYVNYTRNFPAGTYEIYLRESLANVAQAEAVLEKVTSNPTVAGQTTQVLGSFLGVQTGFTYRNFALTDALGNEKVIVNLSGQETLRLRQVTSDPADCAIYQNYLIFISVTGAGRQRATVSSVVPAAGATIESLIPSITVTLQNRDTTLKKDSIELFLNGQPVNPTITSEANGATVAYTLSPLPAPGSTQAARIVFSDHEEVRQTNEWSFTVTYRSLNAAFRQAGPGLERGFKVQVVQAPAGANLENTLLRAEEQLAANSTIPAYYRTNVTASVINYSQTGLGSADGYLPDDELIPGLDLDFFANGTDDIALEILTYLELPAGIHRFGVRCDDGYKMVAGNQLSDMTTPPLAFHNGGPADETFDFMVPQSGLYPFRMIWYERGGGAHVEWFSVNPANGERTLINDPNTAGSIKAFVTVAIPQVQLESATAVAGPYATETGAVLDSTAKTVTATRNGQTRFYRLKYTGTTPSPAGIRILSIRLAEGTVIMSYQP